MIVISNIKKIHNMPSQYEIVAILKYSIEMAQINVTQTPNLVESYASSDIMRIQKINFIENTLAQLMYLV